MFYDVDFNYTQTRKAEQKYSIYEKSYKILYCFLIMKCDDYINTEEQKSIKLAKKERKKKKTEK